jgi:hypothetical protein
VSLNADHSTSCKLALADMLQFIDMNTARKAKTSLKGLMERFEKAPYGFVELDIQWLAAVLFKQGKVSFTLNNSQNVTLIGTPAADIVRYLTKREFVEKLLIEKRERATERQVRSAKEVYKELFGVSAPNSDEEDSLMASFKTRAADKIHELDKLLFEYKLEARFPGRATLENTKQMLQHIIAAKEPLDFYKYMDSNKDEFLDIAEDIAPILSFFNGDQKGFVSKAWKHMDIYNHSKTYVVDPGIIQIVEEIKAILSNRNPYDDIYKLPLLLDRFAEKHTALLEQEAEPIREDVKNDKLFVREVLEAREYGAKLTSKYMDLFDELANKLDTSNEVAAVKNIRYESDALKTRCLNELAAYENKLLEEKRRVEQQAQGVAAKAITAPAPAAAVKAQKNISLRQVTAGQRITIEKEEDIDLFLSELRTKLLRQLDGDTVINLLV